MVLQVNAVILGATIIQDQLQQHFGPDFEKAVSEFPSHFPTWGRQSSATSV